MGKILDLTDILASVLTSEGEDNDLDYLKSNGARALPSNPTASKWSPEAIKRQLYKQPEILFAWLKAHIDAVAAFASAIDDLLGESYVYGAVRDGDGNVIKDTYAKLAGTQTFSGANTFSGLNTFSNQVTFSTIAGNKTVYGSTSFAYNVNFGSSGSDNSKTLDVYFTTNLRGPLTASTILPGNPGFTIGTSEHPWSSVFAGALYFDGKIYHGSYGYVFPDASGNVALESYVDTAKTYALNYVDSEVGKLLDGTNAAMKAKQDEDGNVIKSTYVKVASIVNALTSDATNVPLSAYQGKVLKKAIDDILDLLQSDDNDLDTIQEIVAYIKSNKTLIDAITTSKVNVSDIIDGLTSEIATKPLSAKQGKVLNDRIDAIEDDYIALGLVEVTDYSQSTGEISIIHSSELSSSYDSSSGIVTITY